MRTVFLKLFLVALTVAVLFSGILTLSSFAAEKATAYASSAAELEAALSGGGSVRLAADVKLSKMITVPKGVSVTLDLYGNTLSTLSPASVFAINNLGGLVITDTVGGGEVNSRGIYNGYDASGKYVSDAELVIEGGSFNAKGTNGGGAIFNHGRVILNGGKFTAIGSYALNNRSGAVMVINSATVNDGVYNMGSLTVTDGSFSSNRTGVQTLYNNGALTINGGSFDSLTRVATVSNLSKSAATVNGGSFSNGAGYYVLDGLFALTGGSFGGTIKSKGLTVSGGTFSAETGVGYSVMNASITGGTFFGESAVDMARSWLSSGYVLLENSDGSFDVLDLQELVLAGAKYNLTLTSSFVGNLYVKVPNESGLTVNASDAQGYIGISSIDGAEYYVFKSGPSTNNVTGVIDFDITADYNGEVFSVHASFTTDSYFAAVMERYSEIEEPSDSDIENMTLIMNATRYANELYKYATSNGDYGAYAELLSNTDYQKYLTDVTREDVSSDAVSDVLSLASVFDYASLEIQTGYSACYIFGVTQGYDVSKLSSVTLTYDKLGAEGIEKAVVPLVYDEKLNAYAAPEMPIYDMLADLTVTVSFADRSQSDITGVYNLAAYVNRSDSAIGYAIYAYASAAYEYKVVRDSEK